MRNTGIQCVPYPPHHGSKTGEKGDVMTSRNEIGGYLQQPCEKKICEIVPMLRQ